MLGLDSTPTNHRAGEIAVISTTSQDQRELISSICPHVLTLEYGINFGQLIVAPQLTLCFYGFDAKTPLDEVEWELILSKILGYIFLFDWNPASFNWIIESSRFFHAHIKAPSIYAASKPDNLKIHEKIYQPSIDLFDECQLTLFTAHDKSSVHKVLLSFIDLVISQTKETV